MDEMQQQPEGQQAPADPAALIDQEMELLNQAKAALGGNEQMGVEQAFGAGFNGEQG